MSESDVVLSTTLVGNRPTENLSNDEWIARLSSSGPIRDHAIGQVRELLLRASRHQLSRMPETFGLDSRHCENIAQSAADEATVSVLSRLGSFEGRSRFTTWVYKFGIIHTLVEVRRAAWSDREILMHDIEEPSSSSAPSPEIYAEGSDLAARVREGMAEALTPHQRRVAVAILIDEVPIDVLAERLGTTRSALYKTVHDARKRLRAYLTTHGYLSEDAVLEVNR